MNMFSITPTAYCISQGQNAICIISVLQHLKEVRNDSLRCKMLCSQSKKIRSVVCLLASFYILFDKAASSDGKWADESKQKTGDMVLLLADINKWHHLPPQMSLCCHFGGTWALKKMDKYGGKSLFSPIRAVWAHTGLGGQFVNGNFNMVWLQINQCPKYIVRKLQTMGRIQLTESPAKGLVWANYTDLSLLLHF